MFKRSVCLLMALFMVFGLAACKGSSEEYYSIYEDVEEETSEASVEANTSVEEVSSKKETSSKTPSKQNTSTNKNEGNTDAMKEALDFKGKSITIMREWSPYKSGRNAAHDNFNNWVNKTEKRFNVKIVEKKWKATLASEMLSGVKPEGHLYLIGYNGGGNVIDLANKGYLAYMDDAMKKTGITMKEDIYNEVNVQHGNINGKQWTIGIGFARINSTILYNKKLTKDAGYDIAKLINDKKWTWKMMTEVGKKTTKRNTSGEVTQWGIGGSGNMIKALILSNGGHMLYPDKNGKFQSTLNTENVKEAVQLAYDWFNVDKCATIMTNGQWTDGNKAFAAKKYVMFFSGHAGVTAAYSTLTGEDYGVAYLPMGPRMKKYVAYLVREYSYVVPAAYQDMTTELLLLADELHQWPVAGYTRDDEFRDEWTRYFHTSEQYKMWWNHHYSDDVVRVWDGVDLVQFNSGTVLSYEAILKGSKTAAVWVDNNHNAYSVLVKDNAKKITYTGTLK